MLIGVVGKSNTGKTTFFKAITLVDAEISNRIFTTIEPNQGIAYITAECPCKKLNIKCNPRNSKCINGIRLIPVKLTDVAGLVPGAHEGRGLGNKFLSDIMEASALIHVVDASGGTDSDGNPVDVGSHDPEEDITFLPKEIDFWMLGILKKNWGENFNKAKATGKKIENLIYKQLSGLQISLEAIQKALKATSISEKSSDEDLLKFISIICEQSKPIIIAANKIDLKEAQENFERLKKTHKNIVPCSAESELALREAEQHGLIKYIPGESSFEITGELNEKQKQALEFIKKNVLEKYGSTGVEEVLRNAVFDLLKMIVVYPVANIGKLTDTKGNVLPDAFLVPEGTMLKQFAEKIHTDMAERFIGGLNLEKRKIGADYILKDGDVVEILFSK